MMSEFVSIFSSTWGIVLILVFFGGSIFVHEFGHFLAAKWRGLKVLKFSVGFGPKLFAWKGKDGCEYRISLLPFGGYVALPQLADMGRLEGNSGRRDTEGMTEIERLARTLPKIGYLDKIIVSVAGAFFNVLFAAFLSLFVWFFGLPSSVASAEPVIGYVPETIMSDGKKIPSPAFEAGIKEGDKIIEVDGVKVSDFGKVFELVVMGSGRDAEGRPLVDIKLLRAGKTLDLKVSPALVKTNVQTGDAIRMIGVFPGSSMRVSALSRGFPAEAAGLQVGDVIVRLNALPVFSNTQVISLMTGENAPALVTLDVLRDGVEKSIEIAPKKVVRTRPCFQLEFEDAFLTFINKGELDKNDLASTSVEGALVVLDYEKGSALPENFLRGLVLRQANKEKINSIAELKSFFDKAAQKNESVNLLFSTPDGLGVRELNLPKEFKAEIVPSFVQNVLGYEVRESASKRYPTPLAQFQESWDRTYGTLKSLISPSSDIGFQHFSSPIGIGRAMYQINSISFMTMLSFVVLININLAILNLLPIPVLDGGHILMATISKIIRRPIPEGIVAGVQGVFVVLFLSLMFYVVYFDIMRWKGDSMESSQEEFAKIYYIDSSK